MTTSQHYSPDNTDVTTRDWPRLAADIKAWGQALGFQALGISDVHLQTAEARLQQWLAEAQQRGIESIGALGQLALHIKQQSFMLALNDMYWLSGVLFVAMSALIWMSRPQNAAAAPAGAH